MNRISRVIDNQIRRLRMAGSENLHLHSRKNREHCPQVRKSFTKKNSFAKKTSANTPYQTSRQTNPLAES